MANVVDIEGIGPSHAEKLQAAGISTTDDLLRKGATPRGRQQVCEQTGLRSEDVLKWVNHADLFRLKGVAGEFSELLEAAGVDSVPELAGRVATNLHQRMTEVNEAKKLTRRVPTVQQLAQWIDEAKTMPRAVEH